MQHLYLRKNVYYYVRRVPKQFRPYVGQKIVSFSLNTDSKYQAQRLTGLKSAELEAYWNKLVQTNSLYAHNEYLKVASQAKIYGFPYTPVNQLAAGSLEEISKRLDFVADHKFQPIPTEAVIGGVKKPQLTLSVALDRFWDLKADIRIDKTDAEIRKWENPRRRAVKTFIQVIGDIPIKDFSREHMRKFRDWWIIRIEDDNYSPATANKDFRHVKAVVKTVAEEYQIKLDTAYIFSKLEFDDDNYDGRKPFTSDYIINTLLNSDNHEGLEDFEVAMMKVFSETGVSISELIKLMPEDIILDSPIPYIDIRPRAKMKLKTKHRKRIMPLVGFALEAFKQFPNGFRQYTTDADKVSSKVNSHFRTKELFPSEKHSLYSLRHSFQDRLTNIKSIERIQVSLMGHKFSRELYGEGATLETLHAELEQIKLKKN